MPIKYYVPQGSTQGLIDNGPYQGNLGDYSTVNRCDDDNPVAPPWYRDACNSDPEESSPSSTRKQALRCRLLATTQIASSALMLKG
ncbi:alpha-amylase precursor [Vibrio maritimus]|uniref:Alpha-amylase n=1 Tax=Vibrio maritimus TaxID=990268 RepID=A0A090RPW7_9VIBR|nr:alpha-amylase precursor [Vibrio maritimus]